MWFKGWIIPGGKVEPDELCNPALSAIREAREEAGVIGKSNSHLCMLGNCLPPDYTV